MKTSTKQRLTKAGFNKTVFKRWSNLVIGLLSFIGILALGLFSFSFSFRDSVLEIIASDISYFQYGSYENLIKEVRNMDIDHPQTLEYDKEILIPQSKGGRLDPTFLSQLDYKYDIEVMALSGRGLMGYLSYNPFYKGLLNKSPYTEHAFKIFGQDEGKMRPCLLIKQGSSGFSNWITPEQNPNQCEIVWISDAAYGAKHYLSVQSFSPGGTTIKFTKRKNSQLTR